MYIRILAGYSMAASCKKLKISLILCEHCNEMLTLKTYRRHRKLYINHENSEWITTDMLSQHSEPLPGNAMASSSFGVMY